MLGVFGLVHRPRLPVIPVLGIGPEFFRVSSPGAASDIAGSPVICENGKVIGAMSYEIPFLFSPKVEKKDNKDKKNTFNKKLKIC